MTEDIFKEIIGSLPKLFIVPESATLRMEINDSKTCRAHHVRVRQVGLRVALVRAIERWKFQWITNEKNGLHQVRLH